MPRSIVRTMAAGLMLAAMAVAADDKAPESKNVHCRGVVVDTVGQRVAGATVTLLTLDDRKSVLLASGKAGNDGQFDFPAALRPTDQDPQLIADVPGIGISLPTPLVVACPEQLVLQRATTHSTIQLNSSDNASISGFPLLPTCIRFHREGFADDAVFRLDESIAARWTVTTDKWGTASLAGFPDGATVAFDFSDEQFARTTHFDAIKIGGAPTDAIILRPAGTISGQLTSLEGKPAAGLTVYAQSIRYSLFPGWDMAVTDANGHFTLKRLPPGDYVVGMGFDTKPSEWTVEAATIHVNADHQNADLQLLRGGLITGTVKDPMGHGLPGLSVNVAGPAHPISATAMQQVVTDETGTYQLRVPAGRQRVEVTTPNGIFSEPNVCEPYVQVDRTTRADFVVRSVPKSR